MPGTVLGGLADLRAHPWQVICRQEPRDFPLPPEAFPGQDLSSLLAGLGGASLRRSGDAFQVPQVELRLHRVEQGAFFVGHGLDGAVLTREGELIHQTAAFRDLKQAGARPGLRVETGQVRELGEVFVGFDGAWRNYFHFLCFALVKSFLAGLVLDQSVTIALPDYQAGTAERGASFGETVFRQALEASGLAGRVTLLPPGLYRARRLHALWTAPGEPTDLMHLDAFIPLFDQIAARVDLHHGHPAGAPARLYLARGDGVASRLGASEAALAEAALARYGFSTATFEGTSLHDQVAAIRGATHLVAAHGAGLANLLFGRPGLKVLELNRPLDEGPRLRPWFLLAARARGLEYRMLDTAQDGFSAGRLDAALAGFTAA